MANTAHGFPYPVSTATPDVPRDVKALADAVEASYVEVAHGSAAVTISASAAGTVAVTFPVGRFTAVPTLTATCVGTSQYVAMTSTPTATGATLTARQVDNASASTTVTVAWIAVRHV